MSNCEIDFIDNDSGNESDNERKFKQRQKRRVAKKRDNKHRQQSLMQHLGTQSEKNCDQYGFCTDESQFAVPKGPTRTKNYAAKGPRGPYKRRKTEKLNNPEETNESQIIAGSEEGSMKQFGFGYNPTNVNHNDDFEYPELGKETQEGEAVLRKQKRRANWYRINKMYLKKKSDEINEKQVKHIIQTAGIPENLKVNDIKPIRRRRRGGAHMEECKDDLIVESFDGPVPSGKDDESNKDFMDDDQQSVDTITFTNTVTYGKIVGQPQKENPDKDLPNKVKYVKGYGSVKGLHYMKYIALELLSEHNFSCNFHRFFSNEIKNLIRQISNAKFDTDMRVWVISVLNYDKLMADLKRICQANNIHIEDIPQFAINLMKTQIPYSINNGRKGKYEYKGDRTVKFKLEEFLPPFIFKSLYSFQRDGIKKGLKLYGRVLINDDYGTGKSLQALGLSLAYKAEWPLLILCPKFLLYMWRYEILKWLPGYDIKKIMIFYNEQQNFDQSHQIIIMSFEVAAKLHHKIEDNKFKVVIVDEAQFFRTPEVPNRKLLLNMISNMKRVILLTGCNLLKKPQEIYSLMRMVRPDLMPDFFQFGYRYCDPRQSFDCIDFSNAGNMNELKKLLEIRIQTIYRRKQIFTELPDRMRQKLEIFADVPMVVKIQQMLQNYVKPWESQNPDTSFFEYMFLNVYPYPTKEQNKFLCDPTDESKPSFQKSLKQIFRDLYDYSGLAKLKVTQEIIDNILENNMRMIIFCFHLSFITSIEDHLSKRAKFLYIGKNLDDDYKLDICDKFNSNEEYRAVLIDISEDLSNIRFETPNTVILFAEAFWNSELMKEAENIISTPGEKAGTNVMYVFGRYTLDEYIYKLLYKQNHDLYLDLEPLQLDLQNFRIRQNNLGQNYDELKSTQINWNTQTFATFSQLTQHNEPQRPLDISNIDPLAPTRIFQGGSMTLDNMFNKQIFMEQCKQYNLNQQEILIDGDNLHKQSSGEDVENSQSDINDDDIAGVMSQKQKRDDDNEPDIGIDDDELAQLLSQ